jgi:hypothetical protein
MGGLRAKCRWCCRFIPSRERSVSAVSLTQYRITLHGRDLHFVAYEATPGNARRGEPYQPPMWYLMSEGKRHPVMEHIEGQSLAGLDKALREWAEANAFGPVAAPAMRAQFRRQTGDLRPDDWWGA